MSKTFTLYVAFVVLLFSCKKEKIGPIEIKEANNSNLSVLEQSFFNFPSNSNSQFERIKTALIKHNSSNIEFIERIISEGGLPQWEHTQKILPINQEVLVSTNGDKVTKMQNSSGVKKITDTTILIPLVKDKEKRVNAFLACGLGDSISFRIYTSSDYSKFGYKKNENLPTANSIASRLISMEYAVFGHDTYAISDTNLTFSYGSNRSNHYLKVRSQEKNTANEPRTNSLAYGDGGNDCVEVATFFVNFETGEMTQLTPWTLQGDCSGSSVTFLYRVGGGSTNTTDPQNSSGGGTVIDNDVEGWDAVDENGFYYSRIQILNNLFADNVFAAIPCDKLNILPLDDNTQTSGGYGLMFKRVAQKVVPPAVLSRINNIAAIAPTSFFSSFQVQNIKNAVGPVANCDYFPVRINTLPTGMSMDDLTEYFRKHINDFIDPALGVSFSPYAHGSFSDTAQFNLAFEQSLGSLVHLDLVNDGTVVLSDYYRSSAPGAAKSRFTFSTISSPLDFEHPVSGNREFGVFQNSNSNGYTFYTMGVDRTTDWFFALGNSTSAGFDAADNLWNSVQTKLAAFVNSHGGQAVVQNPVIARPKWIAVEKYLMGRSTFATLKSQLGC